MYPSGNQFPAGQMPPQMYPMMGPQQNMGMPHMGMMPRGGFPPQQMVSQAQMYPPHMMPANQQMYMASRSGFVRPGFDQVSMRAPPPTYSTVTSEEYQAQQEKFRQQQQKQMEEQRKKMEQQMKQRHFQEQQQRLRQFSTMGGRKLDADSLIDSIVGKPRPPHQKVPKPQPNPPIPSVQASPSTIPNDDDGFGDFMTGPSNQPQPASNQPMPPQPQMPPSGHTPPPVHPVEKPKEEKKDLFSMMMQCSDLTAPKEAKGFARKTCVKDVQISKKRVETYKESQKARRWEADTDTLSELFTLPSQDAPTFILPKWMTGVVAVPEVYNHVLEASSRDGQIDTNALYPILLRSGLSRDVLGQIWQICNKKTPGQLVKEELFCILALISVAQNNMNYKSLDVLVRCPQAPIPNLGQDLLPPAAVPSSGAPPSPTPASAVQSSVHPSSVTTSATAAVVMPVTSVAMPTPVNQNQAPPPAPEMDDFADFADFQSAAAAPSQNPIISSPPSHHPFSPTLPPSASAPTLPVSNLMGSELIGPEDKYSVFKSALSDGAEAEDDFGDFKSTEMSADTSSSAASTEAALKTPASLFDESLSKGTSDNLSFSSFNSDSPTKVMTPPTLGEIKPIRSASPDFSDFKMADPAPTKPPTDDKYSALKALVMDKNLYEAPPKSDTMSEVSDGKKIDELDDDWADFKTGESKDETRGGIDMGWASFTPAPESKKPVDWSMGKAETTVEDAKENVPASKPNVVVDSSKANKLFGRNISQNVTPVGTGLSALDILPPDMDDVDEDHEDEGIDKFGTFQGGMTYGNDGLSSIGAPYGGLDDFSDFTPAPQSSRYSVSKPSCFQSNTAKPKDTSVGDNNATLGLDYMGWNSNAMKEDVQSMNSLDFRQKDDSPIDSQSVSSLDFAGNSTELKAPGQLDVQSVASLELKAVSSEVDLQLKQESTEDAASPPNEQTNGEEDGFGEFSSASTEKKDPPKPLDMKELLTEMPRLGDRYGSLMNEPQDSERHIYHWQQCLEQCSQLISQTCNTINAIQSPNVIQEVINSDKGTEYLTAVTEIYKVACRIKQAIHSNSVISQKLNDLILDIESSWGNLTVFIASTHIMPPASSLSFHKLALKADDDDAQGKACGVCLLNVDTLNNSSDNQKLTYGGRQYHAPCANFWVNCVDSTLPALKIPELL